MNKMALLIPVFLLLVITEYWFLGRRRGKKFNVKNTAQNMTIGAIDQFASIVNFAVFFWVLSLVYEHFRFFTLGNAWYIWILAYLAVDFVSYWYHRLSHRIAILWCGHVTHHSSDHFNLSNGFRTSPFQGLNRIPFWIILPLLGFSPEMLFAIFIVSGLYDFLLHTEHFPKMPRLEKILITPSLHRVHHGKNEIYIDKNYGSTFSFWDRMFGTFEPESEKVTYGILSKDYVDGDPVDAIFHHYRYLWNLMTHTQKWKYKLRVLAFPPDYLPPDIDENRVLIPHKSHNWLNPTRYAYFLFVISCLSVLLLLIFQSTMSKLMFFYLGLFFVSGMIVSVKILYKRISINFKRNELLRYFIFSILGLILLYF